MFGNSSKAAKMGEIGKGHVQNGRCEVAKVKVQVQSGFIVSSEMGTAIRKNFLFCNHQQEEPDELKGSGPVPWECSPQAEGGVQFPCLTRLSASLNTASS